MLDSGRHIANTGKPATGASCSRRAFEPARIFVRCARNGATFIFRTDLPDGMDPDEARRRCEEAVRALAEGMGR